MQSEITLLIWLLLLILLSSNLFNKLDNTGIYDNDTQLLNIYLKFLICLTLEVFHFEIFGKDDNDIHLLNIKPTFLTFEKFHLEISGNNDNDKHSLNI